LIGISIVITQYFRFQYKQLNWYCRASINMSFISVSYYLSTCFY
jgi:hypothetical protein